MTSIELTVTGATAQARVNGVLTDGMVGLPVTIRYDSDWDGLTKTLVCKACGSRPDSAGIVKSILNVGNKATVAPEVMIAKRFLYLGVEGRNAEGTLVIPTVWALCGRIQPSADVEDDPSTDPTLPVWAQLQAQIDALKETGVTDEQIAEAVTDYLEEHPIEIPDSSQNVDLTGYATEKWVQEGYQPKDDTDAHADIRLELKALSDRLTAFFDSDDTTLDELSEIVAYIKSNKTLIDAITTSKVSVSDIVNNLNTNVTNKPLSAAQGVVLKGLIDSLSTGKLDASKLTEAIDDALAKAKASGEFDGADGEDYVLTDSDKDEISEIVKSEVPLVKVAEQPTAVSSVDEMTDTSKVYVMPDMSMWAWKKGALVQTFTADDFTYCQTNTDGSLIAGYARIATVELVDLTAGTVSVYCPAPYQYFIYYYTDNDESTYIGKTAWKSGNIDDVLTDTIASGTVNGAKYCRISFRADTDNTSLRDRMDELMQNIIVTQKSDTETYEWRNTGYSYNQPADYEGRIIALETALEGIEYGSF